jgi:hypothetical protein
MCLGVSGASFNLATPLVQWYCNGSSDQNWVPDPNNTINSGGQTYTPIVDQLTGQCISISWGSTAAGAGVIQWPCYGTGDQYWAMVNVGNGYYQLVNYQSGMCMGVSSSSVAPGAQIVQWYCAGPGDQYWRFNAPGNPRVSNDFTILVNGSFDAFPEWMDPSSSEYQAIGMSFGGQETDYHWFGNDVVFPLYSSIFDAVGGLVYLINSHNFAPGENLNIVAHSHGGNVVKIATQSGLAHPINNLVNLGTPQNFDLPGINTSQVVNYCQVSSLGDFVQFIGASPLQVASYSFDEVEVSLWFEQESIDLSNGDYDMAEFDDEEAFFYEEDAYFWFLSTKVDPAANNVFFDSLGHSDLHEVPVWNVLRYACQLPN